MAVIGYTKVCAKSLVTIPKDVRDTLQIEAGDRIVWREEDGRVYVTKSER